MKNLNHSEIQLVSGGFGTSIAVGAATGAVGGPLGSAAARYLAPRIGFLGGAAVGIADKP